MTHLTISQTCTALFYLLCLLTCCCLLAGCDLNGIQPGASAASGSPCQSNCALGPGAGGLHVIIEPDAGPAPLVDAIREAQHSVWLEMYLLSNTFHYLTLRFFPSRLTCGRA